MTSEHAETDLGTLVLALRDAAKAINVGPPRSPWLEPLAGTILLEHLSAENPDETEPMLPFGLEDRPDEQRQVAAVLRLAESGHVFVAGDSGVGRTTMLRTLAGALAMYAKPEDVNLYGIDCGNGALRAMADLPHCGAIVSRTEGERLERLLTMLVEQIQSRQAIFSHGGWSSLPEQRRSVPKSERLPYLLVMVDRWDAFKSAFEGLDGGRLVSAVHQILTEGQAVGVRMVVTGDRSLLIGRMATLAETRLVMRFNDRSSYGLAGLNPHRLPDQISPGRAFRADSGVEVQVGVLVDDTSGAGQRRGP